MFTDNLGTEIENGDIVTFNLSGELALGKVVNVVNTIRYGQVRCVVHIEWIKSRISFNSATARIKQPHVSKVKNTGVIVVYKPNDPSFIFWQG